MKIICGPAKRVELKAPHSKACAKALRNCIHNVAFVLRCDVLFTTYKAILAIKAGNYSSSLSVSLYSSCGLVSGTKPSRGSGAREDNVHKSTRGASRSKLLDVTPNMFVRSAPPDDPTKAPPFNILMRVANNVASTPCTM